MGRRGNFSTTSPSTISRTSRKWKKSGSSSEGNRRNSPPEPAASAAPDGAGGLIRLNRYLALAGWGARRKCDDLIKTGRVSVDGKVILEPGLRVDPSRERVAVDGERIRVARPAAVLMNKPPKILVTRGDPSGRETVYDIMKGAPEGLFPVGRLDRDTEGLLLMTNDGELAFRLTHPRFGIERRYSVSVRGNPTLERIRKLERGVYIDNRRTGPATVRVERRTREGAVLRLTIREGMNREVRRMCEVVGLSVTRLVRVAFGPLRLEGLRPGAWRRLTPQELGDLRVKVGLPAVASVSAADR